MTVDSTKDWATWSEIQQQPEVWRRWGASFDPLAVRKWIDELDIDEIWLTGAGTSAYIGDILAHALPHHLPRLRSVPSTDIVSRPDLLTAARPLVVSFGRSGNSAESLGVLDALDALRPEAPRLNITCNSDSALATRQGLGPQKTICLPLETHDAGFAMTSSFTTMLLSMLGVLHRDHDFGALCTRLATLAEGLLNTAEKTAPPAPQRMVFLGTGAFAYAAREAALKVMELSAGQIPAIWDSTLGFRHGPKSFVTEQTHICIFCTDEPHGARYEADLAAELQAQFPASRLTKIDSWKGHGIPQSAACVLAVLPAQVWAAKWSHDLGLNVDDPFAGRGTLTRVVSGVKLYPVAP